jgi:two-component system chemotaxis sensor kinase CheA
MSDEMEEIISEFITEAEESLDRIEPLFVEFEKAPDDDTINDIFRSMHTIKGAAGFLGFQSIVDVAHSSENIMKKLRDGEIHLSTALIDVILKAIDMLRLLLMHLKDNDGEEEDVAPLVKELGDVLKASKSTSSDETETVGAMASGAETPEPQTVEAPPEASQEVKAPKEEASEPVKTDADATIAKPDSPSPTPTVEARKDSAEQVEEKINKLKENAGKSKETAQNLRVDVSRIDKVMDLAGEVVLVRNRLLNLSSYFDQNYNGDLQTEMLSETVSFLDRVTSDMQLAVMKMRMQPIQKVFSKFPRLVRDIAASVNKEVELQIFGEGTEVDKTVIEHIGDPMTHILRNSIDHGLENAEERIAKGKDPNGKVVINTFQKGNQIVIEISDDGKGMDVEKLKQKAVDKGLITEEDAAKMPDQTATDLVFMPGFSTKEVATELSGRGVGMDVVKTSVSLLNGYVEVSTHKDLGTTFRLCIPLTLAIIQALMVEVSGVKYAIPLSPIEETLMVSKDEIDNVTGQSVMVIRDKVCPLFDLNTLLGSETIGHHEAENKFLIVLSMGDKKFCLTVDKLLGQEEVVIKTLKGIDTSSSYVLGATITGDGKVVFILDVGGMSRNLFGMATA